MKIVHAPILAMLIWLVSGHASRAHVPYLEAQDFSVLRPFPIADVQQSIAVYAWLDGPNDIDVYVFRIDGPTRFVAELLVPVCPAYEAFYPAMTLIGPALPPPALPLPGGYALQHLPWDRTVSPRETFYEPFGAKSYYQGPAVDAWLLQPGLYVILCWDPDQAGGDYVLATGYLEQFALPDLVRALVNTPRIRRNEELHSPCQ